MKQKELRMKVLNYLFLKEDLGILTEAENNRMPQLIHEIYMR
jgi:hypothetical protein